MLPQGIRRLFRLDRGARGVEADVDLELEHHFAAAVDDLVRRGASLEEARAEILSRFGDLPGTRAALVASTRARERSRRRHHWWADWALDVRYALRSLARTPGVTASIVILLSLGIGLNAAVYGILDKLFLQPPRHVAHPEQILRLYRTGWDRSASLSASFNYEQYSALRAVDAFGGLAAVGLSHYEIGRGQQTAQASTSIVTGEFFRLLGARPFTGRFIQPDDDREAATPVAVIGYGYWRRHWGSADAALGATVTLSEVAYTVIGVAPPGFSGLDWNETDIWVPAHIALPASGGPDWQRRAWFLRLFGRLAPGASAALVNQQATAILRGLAEREATPSAARASERVITGPILETQGPDPRSRSVLRLPVVVGGVAGVVLAIAAVNVTVLLLLRAAGRRRELAIRSALGAGRWRTGRLLLVESLALAAAAAGASAIVAAAATRFLSSALLPSVAWASAIMDGRAFAFAGAIALIVGILAGLVPAVSSGRGAGLDDLRAGARASRRGRSPFQAGLLALEAALTVVLLVGAFVFYRSLATAKTLDFGLDIEHLLLVQTYGVQGRQPIPAPEPALAALEDRLRRLPGVTEIAQSANTPTWWWTAAVADRLLGLDTVARNAAPDVAAVSPNFFRANGLAVRRGRGFTSRDRLGAPLVAVVTTSLARRWWPDRDALGQCLPAQGAGAGGCTTVVGVVEDGSRPGSRPADDYTRYYVPIAQSSLRSRPRSLIIRSSDDPRRLVEPVLRALGEALPDLPGTRVVALPDVLSSDLRPWRVGTGLLGAAGALGLLVAGIGLYAVMAFGVRQRRQEFAIRRAVGAPSLHLVRLVVLQGVTYAACGIALGTGLAFWGAQLIAPLVYREVSPRDPLAYLAAALVLLIVCLAGTLVPARAAARADPREALQAE